MVAFDFENYLSLLEQFRVPAPPLPGPGGRLAHWAWPPLRSYNGFAGEQRVWVWQLQRWALDQGTLLRPTKCDICGRTSRVVFHSEPYAAPWVSIPLCYGCHMTVHRRFGQKEAWGRFQARHCRTNVTSWLDVLPADRIDLAGWLIARAQQRYRSLELIP